MTPMTDKGTVIVTGGAGFFGSLLKARLLREGYECVSIDLRADEASHPRLTSVRGDVRDPLTVENLFAGRSIGAVFHCAAVLAHTREDKRFLWSSNVDGTAVVADAARRHGAKLVFTSSNCLWGRNFGRPVREDDEPEPVEIYGRSKWEAEKALAGSGADATVIRCPTIMDAGRLGLLSILFEFIDEGRKVWLVGDGSNRYQFIYAPDLIDACLKAAARPDAATYHIGSDRVRSLKEVYDHVIAKAGTGARTASLPASLILPAMRLAHALNVSPLGPYHYKMIAESFVFDTTRIKRDLDWRPTLSNEEMLWEAYRYHRDRKNEIGKRGDDASPHRRPAPMGVIRILKWFS